MLKIGLLFLNDDWKNELLAVISESSKYQVMDFSKKHASQRECHILITDREDIEINTLEKTKRTLHVVTHDSGNEDALIFSRIQYPFRKAELFSRFELLNLTFQLEEVERLSSSYEELTQDWEQDLKVLKDLHARRVQPRKGKLGPIFFASKYKVGSQGGGDFLDILSSRDRNSLTFVISSCSSYGISSALLTLLMEAAAKFSSHFQVSPQELLAALQEPLLQTLREKDSVSLFLGTLDRRSLEMRYVCVGDIEPLHYSQGNLQKLKTQGSALSSSKKTRPREEEVVALAPESQLLVMSRGLKSWAESQNLKPLLMGTERGKDVGQSSQSFLTELFFQLEKKKPELEEDCSALWIKIKSDAIRVLKKTG